MLLGTGRGNEVVQQFTDKRDRCDQGNFGKVLHAVTASFAFFFSETGSASSGSGFAANMLATIGPMIWWTTVAMTQGRMAMVSGNAVFASVQERPEFCRPTSSDSVRTFFSLKAEHLGGDVAREQAEHMVQRNGEPR